MRRCAAASQDAVSNSRSHFSLRLTLHFTLMFLTTTTKAADVAKIIKAAKDLAKKQEREEQEDSLRRRSMLGLLRHGSTLGLLLRRDSNLLLLRKSSVLPADD